MIMGKEDLEIVNKSIESIKASKKEKELIRSVTKTLEELMHGNN